MTADEALTTHETEARRLTEEKTAADAIAAAKVRLVLGRDAKSVFFATLALRLKYQPDWTIPTAATNGRELKYRPDFVAGLSQPELAGLLAHEVLHCALSHMTRRGDRDQELWNVAADAAFNPLLTEAGFHLPPDGVMPGRGSLASAPAGLAAEEYYRILDQPKPQPQPAAGGDASRDAPGDPDPNGTASSPATGSPGNRPPAPAPWGNVIDAGDHNSADVREAAADWQVAVAQAQQAAAGRGDLPGALARTVAETLAPAIDWRDILRDFVTRTARTDYDWTRPNRRSIGAGVYLPSLRSDEVRPLVIAIDTSGSIDDETLARFAAELEHVTEQQPVSLSIVYHDSRIQSVQEWTPADGPLVLNAVGGGGTDHRPVFDWLESADAPADPAAVILFTDLETQLPDSPPAIPTLWACTGDRVAPWGETVRVNL